MEDLIGGSEGKACEWRKEQKQGNRWETWGTVKEMAVVKFDWITGSVREV